MVESLEFSVKSNPLSFYSFASTLLFSRIFNKAKFFFSTKRKFNLDRPKLQYLPIGTRVLTAKYCSTCYKYWTLPAVY